MSGTKLNALDQALDIAGSLFQTSSLTLSDEGNGYGSPIGGQTGSSAAVGTINPSDVTITGLHGMTLQSIGRFLQVSGASNSGNNGIFLIDGYISSTSVTIVNPNAVTSDTYTLWVERNPYSLQDDLNYERTDRAAIKGAGYDAAIPTYQRPTAVGTNVPANLSNIAGKTTDAVSYNVNKAMFGVAVAATNTLVTLSSAGQLKHSDAVNNTGVPCFDAAGTLFNNDWVSCYVHIVDGYSTGDELTVLTGPHAGERIFGVTYAGSSSSPNSVEVHFYSSPFPDNYVSTNTPYTWEAGQPTTINVLYAYNERLDTLDVNSFRTIPSLGILTDASLANEINDIVQTIGTQDGNTSLSGLLTNTGANFPFFNLTTATPTVVDALNVLNSQIGNRTYTGSYLTSDQTVTASLQALSNAISTSSITRTIERAASNINANTEHTLPGGLTYTLDGTDNGQFMFVYVRGLLKDPGAVSGNNDYAETSTSSVTFYTQVKAGDHINYFTK